MTQARAPIEPPLRSDSVWNLLTAVAVVCMAIMGGTLASLNLRRGGERGEPERVALTIELNEATERELSLLPGVGPVLARRIAENRRRQGAFASAAELVRVPGVGPKTVAEVQAYLIASQPPRPPRAPAAAAKPIARLPAREPVR